MNAPSTVYNVHIYREMRLFYPGIPANSHAEAAAIAEGRPTDAAAEIDDCEGQTLSALVDVAGDADYAQSRLIDFEPARLQRAARLLRDAAQMAKNYLADGLDASDPTEMRIFREISGALDKATQAMGDDHAD